MPMNRVQFQPGLSLAEFLERYGCEAACEQALAQARWPDGFVCPRCGARDAHAFSRFGQAYWQCRACRAQTSLRAGTLFAASKQPLTVWFLAMYLLGQSKNGIAVLELRRHLGVCYRSAWRLKHKLMQAMTQDEADRRLGGVVQVDDAYLGGERPGGTSGRGSENKRPFVIAVATDDAGRPQQAVIEPVPAFSRAALADWAARRLAPGAEVYSDGLAAFRAVAAQHAHTVIQAPPGKAGTDVDGARWVNVVLGNLKRALDGTYHAFGFFKYAERYLAEAAWRFNHRFNLKTLLPCLLATAATCPPWTEAALRNVPVYSRC
jgi:ribosomal protein L37AE/L43A